MNQKNVDRFLSSTFLESLSDLAFSYRYGPLLLYGFWQKTGIFLWFAAALIPLWESITIHGSRYHIHWPGMLVGTFLLICLLILRFSSKKWDQEEAQDSEKAIATMERLNQNLTSYQEKLRQDYIEAAEKKDWGRLLTIAKARTNWFLKQAEAQGMPTHDLEQYLLLVRARTAIEGDIAAKALWKERYERTKCSEYFIFNLAYRAIDLPVPSISLK